MYTEDLAKFIEEKNMPSADIIIYHNHKEIYRHPVSPRRARDPFLNFQAGQVCRKVCGEASC